MPSISDFTFAGPKLDDFDLPRIGHQIGVGEDVIHGVLDVEAAGKSTDSKNRVKMLFEPHVFYRNLSGAKRAQAVKAGLAYAKWKRGYPKDSYPRLMKAMEIDETAALKACSWGFPQILGENHALAGFSAPQAMVKAMLSNEDEQLQAMINFVKNAGLDDELRVIEAKLKRGQKIMPDDCRAFVRGYNGPGYEKNDYHTKLATALNKWARIKDTAWSPETDTQAGGEPVNEPVKDTISETFGNHLYNGNKWPVVESVQTQLDKLGYPEVGSFDGRWGSKTRAAVLAFRADNGLPITPTIDPDLLAALLVAKPRPVSAERKNATVSDLREEGAEDVKAADTTQIAGGVAAAGGGIAAAGKAVSSFEGYGGLVKRVADAIEPIQGFIQDNFWILLIGAGGVVIWQSGVLKNIRLRKHQTGDDVSV